MKSGQKLLHYRILAKLGEGGMGVVWKAADTTLDREVAIKVLPDSMASDPQRLARFRREARTLAALNHPNIVTLHALEREGDRYFLVMEYVTGQTLDRLIPETGLPIERYLGLALPLVEAVAVAHRHNITHRDLKPRNVIVGKDGRVRVLDFGLAKVVTESEGAAFAPDSAPTATLAATRPGVILGTWAYMSPEQIEGGNVDSRSDLFSLGAILYEMATGNRAFAGNSPARLISSILRDRPPPLNRLRSDLPASLDGIVTRCLEKDRARRYPTADELLQALDRLRGTAAYGGTAPEGHERVPESIAVLPFTNLSGDPGQEFFSDGISEEIINALATIDGLRVAARTSAFAFKGLAVDIPEIARRLNVRHVLEGSVRKAGNRLRVTAQLIDASDGCQVWSERFDRELNDIFEVQDEIATSIAKKFDSTGRTSQDGRLVKPPTRNLEAYELYLRGLHEWGLGLGLKSSKKLFERALRLDPDFAAAWASLADAYSTLAFTTEMKPHEAMPKAREAAERALALDDHLASAHGAMAYWHLIYDWNWPAARVGFERTLELNANDVRAMHHYGHLYHGFVSCDFEAGLELTARSVEMDPLAGYATHGYYANLLIMGRYDVAIKGLRRELERLPSEANLQRLLGLCLVEKAMFDEAREVIEEAVHASGRHPWALFELGMLEVLAGRPDAAEHIQAELEARGRGGYIQGTVMSVIPALLGRMDEAFAQLERAYAERDGVLIAITTWPGFRAIWDDPRYERLLERLKLPNPRG